jgi:hypothetical protein
MKKIDRGDPMNLCIVRMALAALLLMLAPLLAPSAFAEDALPAPVNGVTFEEWAAGNARLANNQAMGDMLKVLGIDETTWNSTNEAFLEALKRGDPAGPIYRRYAEVFADPAVGRFKAATDTPVVTGKLASFDDYARVQAHLSVGSRAGGDPEKILKEHGLTVYEFSQEAKPWVQAMAKAAGGGDMEEMNIIMQEYTERYQAQYGLKAQ